MAMSHQERAGRVLVAWGASLIAEAQGDGSGAIQRAGQALDLFVGDEAFACDNPIGLDGLLAVACRAADRSEHGKALLHRVLRARMRFGRRV